MKHLARFVLAFVAVLLLCLCTNLFAKAMFWSLDHLTVKKFVLIASTLYAIGWVIYRRKD